MWFHVIECDLIGFNMIWFCTRVIECCSRNEDLRTTQSISELFIAWGFQQRTIRTMRVSYVDIWAKHGSTSTSQRIFPYLSMAATLSEYIMKEPSTRGNFGNYGKSQEPLSRFRREKRQCAFLADSTIWSDGHDTIVVSYPLLVSIHNHCSNMPPMFHGSRSRIVDATILKYHKNQGSQQ
jgi:hypothetical protein